MKKNFLCTVLMALAAVFSVSAEVKSPYVEQFENAEARPKGWLSHFLSSYSKATYTMAEEGGHSGGYISVNQQGYYYSSYYNNYGYCDMLITPKVEGEVSIWVRKNGTTPQLTFYQLDKITDLPTSAGSFKVLEGSIPEGATEPNLLTEILKDNDLTEWTKVTVSNVPAGTYLGIRGHNVDLDEFTAEKADVEYRASILVSVSNKTGGTNVDANADNEVTIKFNLTLENTGDVDYDGTGDGFKIRLVNKTADNTEFGTVYFTDPVLCGEKKEKEFEITGTPVVKEGTTSNNYVVMVSYNGGPELEASLAWFTIKPYVPAPKFMYFETNTSNQSAYNDVNIVDPIVVGVGPDGTSRTLYMWNNGSAPFTVSEVKVSEGFKTECEPFTLANNEKTAVTVSLDGTTPGYKSGTITFVDAMLGDVVYKLSGYVTTEGEYFEDFEGENATAGMVLSKNWKLADVNANLKTINNEKYLEISNSYTEKAITPLLAFAEGGKLAFTTNKSDNTSATLKVYTSSDRNEWTLVKYIAANTNDAQATDFFTTDKPTGSGYGTYENAVFAIDMPEGNSYVAFEGKGVRLDNIVGGSLVDVAHDLYVVSVGVPDLANVNTRYITNITVRNILATAEKDYSVVLEVDGEQVAEAEETPEIEGGAEASFTLRYTPHYVGEYTGEIVFVSGEDRVVLSTFKFTVEEEKAEATYQVGDYKITSTDPLNTYYNAQSQIIYRADQLSMDAGVKITGFYFNGYNTTAFEKSVKVWIGNSDIDGFALTSYGSDVVIEPVSKEDLTLVYDGTYNFKIVGDNNNKVYEPVFEIPFTTPFEYTGKSLVIMIEQTHPENSGSYPNAFFTIDNSAYDYWNDKYDNRVIENKKDYAEDLDDEPSWSNYKTGYPVTYFYVAKDVVVAKGNVTNEFGVAVENAKVKLTSDDVLYEAVTDAEGAYSMNVINVNLTYVLSAEAEDYAEYTKEDVTFDAKESLESVNDITLLFVDRTATLSGVITATLDNNDPVVGAEVSLTKGEDVYTSTTDEWGRYSITVPEFTDTYALTVKINGEPYANEPEYTFTSKADTKDYGVAWSSLAAISAEAQPVVTVNGGVVTVVAAAGTPVKVYSTTGALVGSAVSEGVAVNFGPLAPGVYVAAGVKVVVR